MGVNGCFKTYQEQLVITGVNGCISSMPRTVGYYGCQWVYFKRAKNSWLLQVSGCIVSVPRTVGYNRCQWVYFKRAKNSWLVWVLVGVF